MHSRDHEFEGLGLKWKVYVRLVLNEEGSTTTWTFMRPDGLTDKQFHEQLKVFDEKDIFRRTLRSDYWNCVSKDT